LLNLNALNMFVARERYTKVGRIVNYNAMQSLFFSALCRFRDVGPLRLRARAAPT